MTDKQLLELAAKAVGLKLQYNYLGGRDANQPWNPLEDDGDAIRLAVILSLNINIVASGVFVSRYEDEPVITEKTDEDIYAATRRAITRAAAEIGKVMS